MEVKIWQEEVIIPTYQAGKPDMNPMFFEKRVYQGSSGVVYPHPIIESIVDEKVDKPYLGVFLENKYLKIMILPEIGGRVQMAYDKIADRHFIYYNQVIKPALVGLCGPWISGGIEFNWPQHHRPSTFEPVDFKIEENKNGSKTIWINEVEKMFRTKGMAGFTLHPDKAYLEIKAQLYNRTNLPQTFLWWANPAVSVGEHYQSVFPPDVNAVFDHGKRDVSTFPIATGTYYKVNYAPGTDISRYKNIPVPTSYMAVNSDYNFVGGYEHDIRAGVLHVADHHVSPGKKQWTWGTGDFGLAWDRNLTDVDGPYIELMTGMFTDNQPDFSWLMPYEEKSFTQYFLPYREVGLVKKATKDILIGLEQQDNAIKLSVFATSPLEGLTIKLYHDGHILIDEKANLSPEFVFCREVLLTRGNSLPLTVMITDQSGRELISYHNDFEKKEIPEAAKAALLPVQITDIEELFLTGQHLEQYRHATYDPVAYYREALSRNPNDFRNNNAMGLWLLRKGQFEKSVYYFEKAVTTATKKNPNPYNSEAHYNLGLALRYQGKIQQAYDNFFKATWISGWQDSGYFSVAQIDILNKDYDAALEHINWSIDRNARNGKAYLLKIHALRKLNRTEDAITVANEALTRDAFNFSARFELHQSFLDIGEHGKAEIALNQLKALSRGTVHNLIECAIEFADCGIYSSAIDVLKDVNTEEQDDPMRHYYLSYYHYLSGSSSYTNHLRFAALADPGYCFPNRLEDIIVLKFAIQHNRSDAKAPYYLGNLWYDKRQYQEAIACWTMAAEKDPKFPTAFRNLGIAAYNKQAAPAKALAFFEQAFQLNTADPRILMELDQLYKRLNYTIEARSALLNVHYQVVLQRDDLYLETAALHNFSGNYQQGLDMIIERKFHPWEGGEGRVSGQYIYSLVELAKLDIADARFEPAIDKLKRAQVYPYNLGEGKLPGAQENDIFYWLGKAYTGLGMADEARKYWQLATVGLSEPSAAIFYNDQQPDKIFYQGLAMEEIGETVLARQIFENLVNYGLTHQDDEVKIDYFAVSLPHLLIFDDDLNFRNYLHSLYISGLGYLGLKKLKEAAIIFKTILEKDRMHFGARTHLKLLTDAENISVFDIPGLKFNR
jgi:tetratricopeptide (TPR) repeat protein